MSYIKVENKDYLYRNKENNSIRSIGTRSVYPSLPAHKNTKWLGYSDRQTTSHISFLYQRQRNPVGSQGSEAHTSSGSAESRPSCISRQNFRHPKHQSHNNLRKIHTGLVQHRPKTAWKALIYVGCRGTTHQFQTTNRNRFQLRHPIYPGHYLRA